MFSAPRGNSPVLRCHWFAAMRTLAIRATPTAAPDSAAHVAASPAEIPGRSGCSGGSAPVNHFQPLIVSLCAASSATVVVTPLVTFQANLLFPLATTLVPFLRAARPP